MALATCISNAEDLIQWLDSQIDGVEIPSELRSRIAAGSLAVALEHQKAIVLLVSQRLYGSAFALARLTFEAYVRGVWLHQCATDIEMKKFEANTLDRTFASFLGDIEKLDSFNSGILSSVKKKSWGAMNSFTHTGFSQVVRRFKGGAIEPNYDDDELLEIVNFAGGFGIMAAVGIAHIANNEVLANALLAKAKETSGLSTKQPMHPTAKSGS
jgi:hypothetical protein